MPQITRKYPGKNAAEIYEKVDQVMERIAQKMSLDYHKDGPAKTGQVSKMGVSGAYAVKDEEVTIELKFPMLVPGAMRQKVQEDIERKLDGLFG
ncbi:polyhydroxyalkanoic acid system family protein [Anaeromyxobacter oryzisoli]|uniref:polyhydroxyalkanoic acid system family protein n=1 Tax=Anaeromyxobacter oryzisoli TaxID=2925408 RepID=UPI001F597270|nr:polyhydroxyalkanoic acid system family protein [Anaeromyxobacter sp. SG63]